jgi:hypothetical protein
MLPFGKYGTFCDTASIPKEKVKAKRKKIPNKLSHWSVRSMQRLS